MHNDVMSHVSK